MGGCSAASIGLFTGADPSWNAQGGRPSTLTREPCPFHQLQWSKLSQRGQNFCTLHCTISRGGESPVQVPGRGGELQQVQSQGFRVGGGNLKSKGAAWGDGREPSECLTHLLGSGLLLWLRCGPKWAGGMGATGPWGFPFSGSEQAIHCFLEGFFEGTSG